MLSLSMKRPEVHGTISCVRYFTELELLLQEDYSNVLEATVTAGEKETKLDFFKDMGGFASFFVAHLSHCLPETCIIWQMNKSLFSSLQINSSRDRESVIIVSI
ncbi:hypothetical protein CDAR_211861 [Caerostris darwini]|uniref:Uncharacterized protein n=1 Tax=Caerostris darwini TaxID=1538125 RepID=A0AAV4PCI4_9ARAC|nr:hypothetical protein CDAR_211861 [Caerostris darwini]